MIEIKNFFELYANLDTLLKNYYLETDILGIDDGVACIDFFENVPKNLDGIEFKDEKERKNYFNNHLKFTYLDKKYLIDSKNNIILNNPSYIALYNYFKNKERV